jgi:lipoprotein-releasing system permease protein
MKNISLFLAFKYFRSRGKGFVSFHSGMAIFGISIGIAILILVTSVMNGFQRELKERVLETIPHASILGDIQLSEFAALEKTLYKNQEVKGVAPYIETQGLLSSGSYLKGVYFYGIVPEHEKTVSIIHNHILSGSFESLEDEGYNLIIGDILAYQLGLNIGDNVNVLVPDTGLGIAGIFPRTKKFKVTGIFSIGAPEVDQSFAYMSIRNASKLLRTNEFVNGIRIKYEDLFTSNYQVREDASRLRSDSEKTFTTTTWQQNYGTLYQAVENERFLVAFMLFMLVILSAYNLMSMLVMTVNEKKAQIAILMTMGATSGIIRNTFLSFGGLVGLLGIFIGAIAGLLISINFGSIIAFIEGLFNVQLLQVYFINYFPIDIIFEWVTSICLITFFFCLLFTIYPSRLASKVDPVEVLKYE